MLHKWITRFRKRRIKLALYAGALLTLSIFLLEPSRTLPKLPSEKNDPFSKHETVAREQSKLIMGNVRSYKPKIAGMLEGNSLHDFENEEMENILRSKHQLLRCASKMATSAQGYVYLMYFNSGYLEFVKSWICNMRIVDSAVVQSTIFVASSEAAALALQDFEPSARVYVPDAYPPSEAAATTYGNYDYFRLTLERLLIQNELIQSGISVFLIEADAVWFSSISAYMQKFLERDMIVSADDRGNGKPLISAGFLYYNSAGAGFFQEYVDKYALNLEAFRGFKGRFDEIDPGEQHLMTKLLGVQGKHVTWLDECHFARGEWYSNLEFRLSCAHPKVLQNNYIVGKDEKLSRAKKWGHWFLSDSGQCLTGLPVPNPFPEFRAECARALLAPTYSDSASTNIMSPAVLDIFRLVDHIFVLAENAERCSEFIAPAALEGKISCVAGKTLDKCLVPDDPLRTHLVDYAEFAGLNHAFVNLFAKSRKFQTIAVVEGDAVFEHFSFTTEELLNLKRLVNSKYWSFIRVGRRPFFLEGRLLPDSCSVECECKVTKLYGTGVCLMQEKGCDMRSSDFYIANDRINIPFASRILDDTFHPTQRIASRVLGKPNLRLPGVDGDILPTFESQWYLLPQLSYQTQLRDLQMGSEKVEINYTITHQKIMSALFNHMCVKSL